jgi:hypothetical protein
VDNSVETKSRGLQTEPCSSGEISETTEHTISEPVQGESQKATCATANIITVEPERVVGENIVRSGSPIDSAPGVSVGTQGTLSGEVSVVGSPQAVLVDEAEGTEPISLEKNDPQVESSDLEETEGAPVVVGTSVDAVTMVDTTRDVADEDVDLMMVVKNLDTGETMNVADNGRIDTLLGVVTTFASAEERERLKLEQEGIATATVSVPEKPAVSAAKKMKGGMKGGAKQLKRYVLVLAPTHPRCRCFSPASPCQPLQAAEGFRECCIQPR